MFVAHALQVVIGEDGIEEDIGGQFESRVRSFPERTQRDVGQAARNRF